MPDEPDHPTGLTCGKAGCPMPNGGLCLEGFDDPGTDCTFAHPSTARANHEGSAAAQPLPDENDPSKEEVTLYHGDALSVGEAGRILGSRAMRVVALAGEPGCGKTTLLATMFDCFQVGPIASLVFARTYTPRAFEQRCHASRVASGNLQPTIERTPVNGDACFLHLGVSKGDGETCTDILFADRSGEHLAALTSVGARASGLQDLARADVLVLMVDGERLCDPSLRGGERYKAALNARALVEGGNLHFGIQFVILLTKLDLVRAAGREGVVAIDVFSSLVHQLRKQLGSAWPISALHVAARSVDGRTPAGLGIDALLMSLVSAPRTCLEAEDTVLMDDVRVPYDRFSLVLSREVPA